MGSCLQMESQRCCRWSIRFLSCPRLRDEVLLGYFKKTTGPGGLDRRVETISKGGSRLLWQPTPHNCYSSRQAQKKKRGWEWRTPFLDLMFCPLSSVWLIYNEQNDSAASVLVYAAADKLRSDSPSLRSDAPRYLTIDVSMNTKARGIAALRQCPTFPLSPGG